MFTKSYYYVLLIFLTLLTFTMGQHEISGITLLILLSTFIKGQIIVDFFMGLHQVRWFWRIIMYSWLLLVIGLIGLAYLLGLR